MKHLCILLFALLAGCSGGDELGRMTSRMMSDDLRQRSTGRMPSLDEFSAPAVRYYYSKHYTASPSQIAAAQTAGKKAVSSVSGKNRYVAVSVPRSEKSAGAEDIMLFDAVARALVDDQVYSLQKTPTYGEQIQLHDTRPTEQVESSASASPPPTSVFVGFLESIR